MPSLEISKNIQDVLHVPKWREAVKEEMRPLEKKAS